MARKRRPCQHRTDSSQCPECHEHLRCPHGKKKDGGYRAKKGCLKCSAGTATVCKHGKWKTHCVQCGNRNAHIHKGDARTTVSSAHPVSHVLTKQGRGRITAF